MQQCCAISIHFGHVARLQLFTRVYLSTKQKKTRLARRMARRSKDATRSNVPSANPDGSSYSHCESIAKQCPNAASGAKEAEEPPPRRGGAARFAENPRSG
jgi:hypothetical protein